MMADLILFNGKIATVDSRETIAEAVAVKFGRFLAVGRMRKLSLSKMEKRRSSTSKEKLCCLDSSTRTVI